ncbi:MAG: hypothetical protein ACRD2R_07480, partial [Terriglobales bacterium]
GNSDFDRTHRLVVTYNYELPFAKWLQAENHGLGKIVHGWSVVGTTTYQSGTPIGIYDFASFGLQDMDFINGNFATLAPGATLADVLTTGPLVDRINGTAGPGGDQGYVNLNAFTVGGNCVDSQNVVVDCSDPSTEGFAAIGNLGRNIFRGPRQQNWDLSLVKTTKVTERVSVNFHADFFNVWNHPAFASPQAAGGSFGNYGIVDVGAGDTTIINTVNDPRTIQFGLKINF